MPTCALCWPHKISVFHFQSPRLTLAAPDARAPVSIALELTVAVPSFGEKLIARLESLGALEARRLRLKNHFHSLDWQAVDAWLAVKDVEGKARADDRAEESLSISRMALSNSSAARRISTLALIVSAPAPFVVKSAVIELSGS